MKERGWKFGGYGVLIGVEGEVFIFVVGGEFIGVLVFLRFLFFRVVGVLVFVYKFFYNGYGIV